MEFEAFLAFGMFASCMFAVAVLICAAWEDDDDV